MGELSSNLFHMAFYSVAFILCATVLYYMRIEGRSERLQSKYFILLTSLLMCNTVSGMVCSFGDPLAATQPRAAVAVEIFQFLYFFFHAALAPLFYLYSLCVVGKYTGRLDRRTLYRLIPFLVTEVMLLSNPVTSAVYYYDANYVFHRNWAEMLFYLAAGYYLILTFIELLYSWRAMTSRRRKALMYFVLLTVVAVLIQFVNINIKSELVTEALALMGVMLSVEFEEDRLDADTGFYNRNALRTDLDSFLHVRSRFFAICLKIDNLDLVRRLTGSANLNLLANSASEFLRTIAPPYQIYHPNPETFLLLFMDQDRETVSRLADRIAGRFQRPWTFRDVELPVCAIVMFAELPGELRSVEDVFFLVDRTFPPSMAGRALSGSDLTFLTRRMDVEGILRRGVSQRLFQVYYQPTYRLDGHLHGAEALVRLGDGTGGLLMPDEFVPIAEEIGVVGEMDEEVLRQVCAFLQSGVPEVCGMDSVNVNLSVIQCMQPGFVQRIRDIVDSFRIRHSLINFEITESVAATDYHLLADVIGKLKDSGFQFSMDDYGTGYSNVSSMFSLSFDVVKIDKSILWNAMENQQGRVILENTVRMIRQMGQRVLVEGVETREQLDLLRQLGVDYLQGFYFSRPVPRDQLVSLAQAAAGRVAAVGL